MAKGCIHIYTGKAMGKTAASTALKQEFKGEDAEGWNEWKII